jgi:hypothetical protein
MLKARETMANGRRRSVSGSTAKTIVRLALATLCSTALSISSFELILRNTHLIRGSTSILVALAVALASVSMPFGIAIHAARASFRRRAAKEGLLVIFTGYMAVLISFAGIYYSFAVISNYHEAHSFADFYIHSAKLLDQGTLKRLPVRGRDEKAFSGMRYSTWSGLADVARPSFWHPSATVSDDLLLSAARRYVPKTPGVDSSRTFQPRFQAGKRLPTFLQCLHFSVVTMATVGYGDMNPDKWYSQLAVDIQILIGQILIVFGLGCVLGRWWE